MVIFGIEGTAWAASAAVYDRDADTVHIETDAYQPDSGGIDPGEAAEHMRAALPDVIDRTLDTLDAPGEEIEAVAFSRGPGLGPCLRVAGTAARALATTLDVPLVGVNHMLAHCEIGRHEAGFDRPVCLNASGANAHVLGFHGGRYRVLGETTDIGIGNALDKFTRHLGWTHPGGPKVEDHAREGGYVELPYVVKGMDFSFSGIMSAAKAAVDRGEAVEDVCHSFQENAFGMLAEVSERALSLTGSDELVLGGGVAQNDRLQAMLAEMCEQRGADFHAPEPRFLRDNAGMIAVLGARMYEAGDTVAVEDSNVIPKYRPDEVPVSWRSGESVAVGDPRRFRDEANSTDAGSVGPRDGDGGVATTTVPGVGTREARVPGRTFDPDGNREPSDGTEVMGAEAVVSLDTAAGLVYKRRVPKSYRHPELDRRLRRDRTVLEARLTSEARRRGVPTPVLFEVDPEEGLLTFEYVGDRDLRAVVGGGSGGSAGASDPDPEATDRVRTVGRHLATLHGAGFVHGDPTTRNVRVDADRTYLIDFGLGYHTEQVEDFAMDLHVFEGSLGGTADDPERLRAAFEEGYREAGDEDVIAQLRAIEDRGRYQERDPE